MDACEREAYLLGDFLLLISGKRSKRIVFCTDQYRNGGLCSVGNEMKKSIRGFVRLAVECIASCLVANSYGTTVPMRPRRNVKSSER